MADFDCVYSETVELTACALDVIIEVTDETVKDLGDGAISFDVMGGNDPLSFSIDSGLNFQDSPDFPNLTNGIYEVLIQDAFGCFYEDTVEVSYLTSTSELTHELGYQTLVLPNPTEGVFKVLLNFPSKNDIFTDIDILNIEGKLVRRSKIAKWNGIYEGSFSLVSEPDGMYFVRFKDRRIKKMVKILKQSK
jgi:hypothetical protein